MIYGIYFSYQLCSFILSSYEKNVNLAYDS